MGKVFLLFPETIGDTHIHFPEIFIPVPEDLVLPAITSTYIT